MARSYAQIHSEIWKDDDFKADLSVDGQWLYFVLLSQPNLNLAGVLPLQDRRWKKLANDVSPQRLTDALEELQAHRYVVVDEDTEEVLIRTFIRNDGLWKQPNVLKSALGHIENTMSEDLRAVLRHELERLPLDELPEQRAQKTRTLIERVTGTLPETLPEGFQEPPQQPISTAEESDTGQAMPPFHDHEMNPQVTEESDAVGSAEPEGFTEGFSQGSGVGAGAGVGAGESLGEEEIPMTSSSAPTATPKDTGATCQTLIGEWIDHCPNRPPKRTVGHMSKEIKALLDEGIDPDNIRRGIAAWMTKQVGPSSLPSFVNQVMNVRQLRPASGDDRFRGGARAPLATQEQWDNGEVEINL